MQFILKHGLMRKFRRGIVLSIRVGFRCNLDCPYCATKKVNGKFPKDKDALTLDQWKYYIKNWPTRIKYIEVSGGEPTIYPKGLELIDWLLENKYYVVVYTNLKNIELIRVRKSRRLLIRATYHRDVIEKNVFLENYNILNRKHYIRVHEFDKKTLDVTTDVKPILYDHTRFNSVIPNFLRLGPGPTFALSCRDFAEQYEDV